MRYWLLLAVILLGTCSGCGAMEDFILGPEPSYAQPGAIPQASCGAPPPTIVQTQEPPR